MDLAKVAKEIIKKNLYLTLGTTDGQIPWTAPLFYAVDPVTYNFYFIPQLDSLHPRHLLQNPTISFAIFDSRQKEGAGNGVQGSGQAFLLSDDELPEAFKHYHTTYVPMKTESFTGEAPYRFFKVIPDHFYILDPEAKTDKRIEVKLL